MTYPSSDRADHPPLQGNRMLTGLDFDAVDIARRDGPRSGNPRSLVARLSRLLFGVQIARPLGSERLETIRQFSVRAWFLKELHKKDLLPLFELGLSSNDVWRLLAYIGMRRGFIPKIDRWPG